MPASRLAHEETTRSIIGAFYEVNRTLGFGFLEAHYALALERELRAAGHSVAREYAVRVFYKGEELGFHRLDLVVDGAVVVEVKSTPALHPVAKRQLHNYLRAMDLEVGLLLHFGPDARFYRVFAPRHVGPGKHGAAVSALSAKRTTA